jgi:hypothetical protein
MKRPYEKPTLTDLSLPTARAGWLPQGGKDSPQGTCATGLLPGQPAGGCGFGSSPNDPGSCHSGTSASASNFCSTGQIIQ